MSRMRREQMRVWGSRARTEQPACPAKTTTTPASVGPYGEVLTVTSEVGMGGFLFDLYIYFIFC